MNDARAVPRGRRVRLGVRILGGFATAFVVVLVVGALSWVQVRQLLDDVAWVDHTHTVLAATEVAMDDLLDGERAMESFLLTTHEDQRAIFSREESEFEMHVARLKELVADAPVQVERLTEIQNISRERFARANDEIAEVRRTGLPVTLEGKLAWAAELRTRVEEFQQAERVKLEERKAVAHEEARLSLWLIGLATGMLVLTLLAGTWLLSRSITQPLLELSELARRVGQGEPPRFPSPRNDELGDLAAALEEMVTLRHAAEQRTRDLLAAAPEAYFLAEHDGRFVDVNAAACALLGYSREELVGKNALDLIAPEDVQSVAVLRGLASAQPGETVVAERILVRRDGSRVTVEANAKILPDGMRQSFMRDLSERKRKDAEQQFLIRITALLAASLDTRQTLETVAQELVTSLGDLCIIDIAQGDKLVREIIACGDPQRAAATEQLRKYAPDRMQLARAWPGLLEHRSHIQPRLNSEAYKLLAANPEHRKVLEAAGPTTAMATPMISRGQLFGHITMASFDPKRSYGRDDAAVLEEVARRTAIAMENARLFEKTQQAVRAREDVLHVVAHDLRNPLNAVQLQASTLVRRKAEDERRVNARRAVDAIKHSLGAANRLIEDLLDVARVEQGGLLLRTEPHAPGELVKEAVELLTPAAMNASITLEAQADGVPAELQVDADRDRVVRVLSNLIGNALKFTPRGGRVQVQSRLTDGELLICVADNGPGIGPDELKHVFDRFWQADRKRGGGVGLGLAIARSIVEQHGGRIWAESTPGKGATLSFTLPVRGVPPKSTHP